MTDALVAELLARPVGPEVPSRKTEPEKDCTKQIEVSGDIATVTLRGLPEEADESASVAYLRAKGEDPALWEPTGFRSGEWTMANGEMGVSNRYTFRRANTSTTPTIAPEVVESWRQSLLASPFIVPTGEGKGGTYVVLVADPQLGKRRTEEAVENYRRGIQEHVRHAASLGSDISSVHVAWMGDETENVVNSYGNQPYTIELNRTQQLELDYDLRVHSLKEVLGLGVPVSASSVISNHGEWTRNGGKEPVTSQGDNASTYVARQVARLFEELESHTGQRIEWHIGGGDPGVSINLSGVDCYFSHGYIEKGRGTSTETRTRNAIERQILGKTEDLGQTKLWFMAHYHHFYTNEFEGRTLFGCPALEAERSSEYMLNQFGVWSPPGMLGMVVGSRFARGWSNLNVF